MSRHSLIISSFTQHETVLGIDMPGNLRTLREPGARAVVGADLDRSGADMILREVAEEERARHDPRRAVSWPRDTGLDTHVHRPEADGGGTGRRAIRVGVSRPQHDVSREPRLGHALGAGEGSDLGVENIRHAEEARDEARAGRAMDLDRRALLLDEARA